MNTVYAIINRACPGMWLVQICMNRTCLHMNTPCEKIGYEHIQKWLDALYNHNLYGNIANVNISTAGANRKRECANKYVKKPMLTTLLRI